MAIAGGSVSGGTDHIVAAMLAIAAGIDATQVKYIPYDAGGKAMAGLLSGEVQALSSGLGEVIDLYQQDWVRILCVASDRPIKVIPEVPTCQQAGAERLFFVNWRGFFAPPSISPQQAQHLRGLLGHLVTTKEWLAIRQRYGWVDLFQPGSKFTSLLTQQEQELQQMLTELGFLDQ